MNSDSNRDADFFDNDFLRRAIHDLRSPSNTIKSFMELLLNEVSIEELSPEAREFFGIIQSSADEMQQLLSALALLTRVRSEAVIEPVGVIEVLRDAITELSSHWPEFDEQSIDMHVDDFQVRVDKRALQTCLESLLSNCQRFRHAERPLQIRIWRESARSGDTLFIADNGIGISVDQIAKCLEPFERLNSRRDYPGSGLGLTIARAALAHIRGKLELLSDGSSGTTVKIWLPHSSDTAADDAT